MRCKRQLARVFPRFSSIISKVALRRPRRAGCNTSRRRSKLVAMFSVVSALRTSSGSLCGTTRMESDVGPAVVLGNNGGKTSTSTDCCVPPKSVTVAGLTVVHAAAMPAGVSTNVSVVSPRLTTVSCNTATAPGVTSTSPRENQA